MIATEYQLMNNYLKPFVNTLRYQNLDMATLGERLKQTRKAAKLSQEQLSARSGLSQPMISALERDEFEGTSKIAALASVLGVRAIWLAEGKGPMKQDPSNVIPGPEIQGKVPVISWVAASAFATAVDNFHPGDADDWCETTVPIHRHTYALRVDGPSMTNPTGQEPTFPHGCKIVVEPDLIDRPENMVGLFVIVRRHNEDEATFKQLIRDGGRFILHPLNPQFENLPFKEGDVLCGVVREKPVRYV